MLHSTPIKKINFHNLSSEFIAKLLNNFVARGLRSLSEAILTDAMYDLPSSDEKVLNIDKDYTQDALNKNLLKRLELAS